MIKKCCSAAASAAFVLGRAAAAARGSDRLHSTPLGIVLDVFEGAQTSCCTTTSTTLTDSAHVHNNREWRRTDTINFATSEKISEWQESKEGGGGHCLWSSAAQCGSRSAQQSHTDSFRPRCITARVLDSTLNGNLSTMDLLPGTHKWCGDDAGL